MKMVREGLKWNPNLEEFFEDLVEQKKTAGGSRSPHLEAVNSMCQVLRTPGGGRKMRQEDKDFFIEVVGEKEWGLGLRKELVASVPHFKEKYHEFCSKYNPKHVADERIRAVIKENRRKVQKKNVG